MNGPAPLDSANTINNPKSKSITTIGTSHQSFLPHRKEISSAEMANRLATNLIGLTSLTF